MNAAVASPGAVGVASPRLRRWEPLLGLLLVAVLGWWSYRAFHEPLTFDVGLAYQGGEVAWDTGHPETLATWISTPFLAVIMALLSQVMSADAAADLITALNVAVVVTLLVVVWRSLLNTLPRWAWWLSLCAAAVYAPMVSSLWWKQFNLVALGLAVLGFWLVRGGSTRRGAAAVAVSICFKPIVVLLPIVLLLRRDTRRAGVYACAFTAALLILAQAVLALRAGDLGALDPFPALRAFSERAQPANVWACHYENFSPTSTICRLSGGDDFNVVRAAALLGTGLFAALLLDLVRGLPGRSWELFALACVFSPMVSPIAWSHYQVLLAPLMLVLFWHFVRERARWTMWLWLAAAYALAMAFWQPYGTLPGWIREQVIGQDESQRILVAVAGVAQFSQYVLLVTACVWFAKRQGET